MRRNDYNIKEEKNKGEHITEEERYKIEGYKEIGLSNRKIGKALKKSHSAINEEINRGMVVLAQN